jgi:CBS domain-containing protein
MYRATRGISSQKEGVEGWTKTHKAHNPHKEGGIMRYASENVVSTQPSNSIKNAAALMRDNDVRRLPVIASGTKRLMGLLTAIDILDFLGGGEKYNIIGKDYGGNFLAAINSPISKIIRESQYLERTASIEDAISIMLDKHSSCIPIVSGKKSQEVLAIVSERDLLPKAEGDLGVKVSAVMKRDPITLTPGTMLSDASKIMVRNQLRRLPVMSDDQLVGVLTVFDLLGYLEDGNFRGFGAEENLSVRIDTIMENNVITAKPDDDISKVIGLVEDTGYGGFPVVADDKLKGIITTTDLLRWVYNQG